MSKKASASTVHFTGAADYLNDNGNRRWTTFAENEAAGARPSPAVSAIQYALSADDGLEWLEFWNEGEFEKCRRGWPDAPEDCFIGADPLHPETQRMLSAARHAIFPLSEDALVYDDSINASDRGKLPEIARTAPGQRLYALAYARGRARERLNASRSLRPSRRSVEIDASALREMRVILPEGGHAKLFWPEELTADSARMLSEMFATAMEAFARAATVRLEGASAPTAGDQS
ncbi:hypothetical protein F3J20_30210 [Paraburkholderia sp. Cy-641]|uniref:hypothetical protein n=1 Tax=Paraburkholderia sp. Cy-641 TaxID=2608337 RepID=UPI001422266D|nr:hypothetical protein [Paraburkholderia sp. Cy-641]NIF81596.1 hypothetical protein [Paraburkholderia sp. Cy-641]